MNHPSRRCGAAEMTPEIPSALSANMAEQFSFATADDGPFTRAAIRLVERFTGQPALRQLYLDNQKNPVPGESFFEAAIRLLRLRLQIDEAKLASLPKEGPIIFVSNHPYGVLDGLVACALVGRVRPDFKILLNAILTSPPEMAGYSLPVDFREHREALETNLHTRAEARRHLAAGGAILIFPGGTVSTRTKLFNGQPAADPAWKPFVSQLIQKSGAHVVPLFFEGENGWMFHAASHFSVTMRLALLFHEVHSQIGQNMRVQIGDVLTHEELKKHGDRKRLAQYLRRLTYEIGGREEPGHFGPRLSRRLGLEHTLDDRGDGGDDLNRLKANS